MNKGRISILLTVFAGIIVVSAQNAPPGTISRPPGVPPQTNQPAQAPLTNNVASEWGNVSFTNSAGGVYSVEQLAGQLQMLRQSIDQTLPILGAFTQTYSNAVPGARGLGGAISDILSGVLNRGATNAPAGPGQGSGQGTNLLVALERLLTTNAPPGAVSRVNFQDVTALQERLQAIPPLLQALNVQSNVTQWATPSAGPFPTNAPMPTGR